MKVLFPVLSNPYFDSSAIGNRYEGILNGLLNCGAHVVLIITGGYNSLQEYQLQGRKINNPNLEVIYSVFTFQNTLWKRRINSYLLPTYFRLINLYKLKKYYCSTFDYLFLTGGDIIIRKSYLDNLNLLKGKTIIELSEYQNIYDAPLTLINRFKQKKIREYASITKEALNHIDYFAVMTKTLIKYYKSLTQNQQAKFIHLPMTVDLQRFQNIPEKSEWKKPYIAFTGTYTNLKDGVDILIKSFGKLSSSFPMYHLYLAGFYHEDVIKQKKIILDQGLENKITYLGALGKDIIPEFLGNADLLVLPRPDSRQAQGGFPTKLGEYLATGNPVSSTRVGEIPDYLTDGESVYFAEPGSVDSFANAMRRALSNPEEAKRIGMNGRKVAEECFNKDIQSKILYDFLKENLLSEV